MEKSKTMYEEIFLGVYRSIDWMVQAYNRKDLKRNQVNYGSATAFASVLRSMGHEVDLRVYDADGFLLTNSIVIDGKTFDFFHN